MIVRAPDGSTVYHGKNAFQYLPDTLQDVIRLNSESTVILSLEPFRYSDEVIFKLNDWEVVKAVEEELAVICLTGMTPYQASRRRYL